MFKSKKKKAAAKVAKIKAAKIAAAKKTAIKTVPRPGKPIGPALKAVNPAAHGKSPNVTPVKIHMLGNALVDDIQYMADMDYTVPMSTFRAIGTSCVSMAKWRAIKEKSGLNSLHK